MYISKHILHYSAYYIYIVNKINIILSSVPINISYIGYKHFETNNQFYAIVSY